MVFMSVYLYTCIPIAQMCKNKLKATNVNAADQVMTQAICKNIRLKKSTSKKKRGVKRGQNAEYCALLFSLTLKVT